MKVFQNYEVRTHDDLVKDLTAAHNKLRWQRTKLHVLYGLVTASLASSITALVTALVKLGVAAALKK